MVDRVHDKFNEIPSEYKNFLDDIRKNSPVSGLLQATKKEALDYLKQYCLQQIDLRSPRNIDKLKIVQLELPAIWLRIVDILKLEKEEKYLPAYVSLIIIQLLKIRRSMYKQATKRKDDGSEYFSWDGESHPCMFYPNWKIVRWPSNYQIKGSKSTCNKEQNKPRDHSYGLFSVGCACPLNITLGFELMLKPETCNNMFRILSCLDIDLSVLNTVIYDNGCNLSNFINNREARELKNIRTLVDAMHYRSHHGCSSGYNSQLYKETLKPMKGRLNTSGREQMHSKLRRLQPSFRQMNYVSWIQMHKVFFGINNLTMKGKLGKIKF